MSVVPLVAVVVAAPAAGNLVVAVAADTRPVAVLVGSLAGIAAAAVAADTRYCSRLVAVVGRIRRYIRFVLALAGCSGSGPDTQRLERQFLSHTRAGLVGSRSFGF